MSSSTSRQGFIHVYTGDGKGKSTAAAGLALRALAVDMRVCIAAFMKHGTSGELALLESLGATVLVSDAPHTFSFRMTDEQKKVACQGNNRLLTRACNTPCDMLILDEALNAVRKNLIDQDNLKQAIIHKDPAIELILTGRSDDPFFVEYADYVTEMRCIAHPYHAGVKARKGIEF